MMPDAPAVASFTHVTRGDCRFGNPVRRHRGETFVPRLPGADSARGTGDGGSGPYSGGRRQVGGAQHAAALPAEARLRRPPPPPTGRRCGQMLAAAPVDLVVLDIRMPGEDGITLARHLRAEGAGPAIIFLTASGETIDRIIGLEIGADDYLAKPFDPRELLARVRSVLRRQQPQEMTPAPRRGTRDPFRPLRAGPGGAGGWSIRAGPRCRSRRWSSTCCRRSPGTPTRCCRATGCSTWRTRNGRRSTAASTSGSAACGRRSSPTRTIRPTIKTVRGIGYIFVPA